MEEVVKCLTCGFQCIESELLYPDGEEQSVMPLKTICPNCKNEVDKAKDLTGLVYSNGFKGYVDILKEEWEIEPCNVDDCFCKKIVLKKDNKIQVYPSALLSKRVAEHIVKIHNKQLKK